MANTVSLKEFKLTHGYVCDSEPVNGSTNAILSGGVYTAIAAAKTAVEAEIPGAATTTSLGTVKKAAVVAEAAGENPTAAEFKALLDALKAAGIMATE